MTISPAIRIVALVGLLAALGVGAFTLIELNRKTAAQPLVVHPPHPAARTHARSTSIRHHATEPADGLSALRHALAYHRVVVAVVYAPRMPDEAGLVDAARAGAKAAHVGFVTLDVRHEKTAETLAMRYPYATDPSVLIFTRPGRVVTQLQGVQESTIVAQAAADARQ